MAQISCVFFSYFISGMVDLEIIIPSCTYNDWQSGRKTNHSMQEKYPVLYLLHGYSNSNKSYLYYSGIVRYAEERRIAVVMPSVGNKAYMNSVYGENYFEFISKEMPEFVTSYFPISSRPEDTFIAGISMGGYGALVHGLSHPEMYAAIGAFSPALHMDQIGISHEFPHLEDVGELLMNRSAEELPEIYMCVGSDDFLRDSIVDFHKELQKKNLKRYYFEEVPEKEHEWGFWDSWLPGFLDWLPRTDVYASMEKNQV